VWVAAEAEGRERDRGVWVGGGLGGVWHQASVFVCVERATGSNLSNRLATS